MTTLTSAFSFDVAGLSAAPGALLHALSALLPDLALKGAVLLLLAVALDAVLRRASAATRHAHWQLALGGTLALALLAPLLPRVPVALPLPDALAHAGLWSAEVVADGTADDTALTGSTCAPTRAATCALTAAPLLASQSALDSSLLSATSPSSVPSADCAAACLAVREACHVDADACADAMRCDICPAHPLEAARVVPRVDAPAAARVPMHQRHDGLASVGATAEDCRAAALGAVLPGASAGSAPSAALLAPTAPGVMARAADALSRLDVRGWLTLAWAVGVVIVLVLLAGSLLRARSLAAAAYPLEDAEWLALLDRTARELSLKRKVRLLIADGPVVPMTWGWSHPVVLLPADAHAWSAPRRRQVLLHELAHVQRGDWLTQLFAQVACALYWYQPLAWLAARRLRQQREHACDDRVLAAGNRASDYAGHLLDIARTRQVGATASFATLAMARPSQLEGRLLAVLDARRDRRALPGRSTLLAAAATSLLVLALACVQPVTADAHDTPTPSSSPSHAVPAEPDAFAARDDAATPDAESLGSLAALGSVQAQSASASASASAPRASDSRYRDPRATAPRDTGPRVAEMRATDPRESRSRAGRPAPVASVAGVAAIAPLSAPSAPGPLPPHAARFGAVAAAPAPHATVWQADSLAMLAQAVPAPASPHGSITFPGLSALHELGAGFPAPSDDPFGDAAAWDIAWCMDDAHEWMWSVDGDALHVTTRDWLESDDTGTKLERVGDGGMLLIERTHGGVTDRIELTCGGEDEEGNSVWTVTGTLGGTPAEPAALRAELDRLLPDVLARTGMFVPQRVEWLLAHGGVTAALAEASAAPSEDVRATWFHELLVEHEPGTADAAAALAQMSSDLPADARRAELLACIGPELLADPDLAEPFFAAVDGLDSDADEAQVLDAVLNGDFTDSAVLARALASVASGLESDAYAAEALRQVPGGRLRDDAVRQAFLGALDTVGSDSEAADVLQSLLDQRGVKGETLAALLDAATRSIESDSTLSDLLQSLPARTLADERVRASLLLALASIDSDSNLAEVLEHLLGDGELPAAARADLLDAATAGLDSDASMADLLTELPATLVADTTLRPQLDAALATISSPSYLGEVREALGLEPKDT